MAKERRYKSIINNLTEKELNLLISNPLANDEFKIIIRKFPKEGVFQKLAGNILIPLEQSYEADNSVKLYTKSDNRLATANLTNCAQRLYLHILHELPYGMDYFEINSKRYMVENRITSVNTYKAGLSELSRYLFIYPSLIKGVYWINPKLFFCGNRIEKYPNNLIHK